MKAPFIWFGGKSRVADIVWSALGDVTNYIEPFAGSLAVLLGRPDWHRGSCETVNDIDSMICNFWRAVTAAPDGVVKHADWPVNETDLLARHAWLIDTGLPILAAKLPNDPLFFDTRIAGWWLWGINIWIGGGWCKTKSNQLPHLGNGGRGINRKLPHLGDGGRGDAIQLYMMELSDRIRDVRVCCGDWKRVVTRGAMTHGYDTGDVGVFLDPPYSHDTGRDKTIYTHEMPNTDAIADWCKAYEHQIKIVLCGYEGEYDLPGWEIEAWSAGRVYGNAKSINSANSENRKKERIWFSPLCERKQIKIF